MAKHVMGVHLNAAASEPAPGELNIDYLKKYINYCRMYVSAFDCMFFFMHLQILSIYSLINCTFFHASHDAFSMIRAHFLLCLSYF